MVGFRSQFVVKSRVAQIKSLKMSNQIESQVASNLDLILPMTAVGKMQLNWPIQQLVSLLLNMHF
jgi:hypothetical protein